MNKSFNINHIKGLSIIKDIIDKDINGIINISGINLNTIFGDNNYSKVKTTHYVQLGDGYELRPIKIFDEAGKFIENKRYCNVYHNDEKLSNEVFSERGSGSPYRDGYCILNWHKYNELKSGQFKFESICSVVINDDGNIVLKNDNIISSIYHIGGHLISLGDDIYNLQNGQILVKHPSNTIHGKNTLIFEHRFEYNDKSLPLGLYMVNYWDCKLIKIDDINRL